LLLDRVNWLYFKAISASMLTLRGDNSGHAPRQMQNTRQRRVLGLLEKTALTTALPRRAD